MLHRMMRYEVRKEALPQVLPLVAAFVDEVRRKEGPVAFYRVWQEKTQPGRFLHVMAFRAKAGADYHDKTAWNKRFLDALKPLCISGPDLVEADEVVP